MNTRMMFASGDAIFAHFFGINITGFAHFFGATREYRTNLSAAGESIRRMEYST